MTMTTGRPDPVAEGIADFVLTRGQPSGAARHEAARRVLDAFALAVASAPDRAVGIARSLAEPRAEGGATMWGAPGRYDVHGAALANGVGARYRDMNDAYFNVESLHPSDMVPALCALAEAEHASTAALLDAVCIAYDVAVDMADTWRTSSRGADHVNLVRFGVVAGAARLVGATAGQVEQALAIAATTQVATRQTRRGQLTMWKGYAAADHAVAGLRAVRMALAGVEGPTLAFTGDQGFQALAVDPATRVETWPYDGAADRAGRVLDTHLKVFPVGYLGQAVAEVALALHGELAGRAVTDVRICTYHRAKDIMGDPDKWAPDSAETADHSLPYIAVLGLLDGRVDITGVASRWADPDVRQLLTGVRVDVDDAMTATYPEQMPVRLEVTAGGEVLTAEVQWPRGHARRPLPDAELGARATAMLRPCFGDAADGLVAGLLAADGDRPAAALWTP